MSPLSDEMRTNALAINRREAAERRRLTIASSAEAPPPATQQPATPAPIWPEPKPLSSGKIPVDEFDYEFLPVALREWVRDISNRLQCPPDYVAVAAVAAFATLIGRRLGIRPQEKTDWLEIPNLWGMIIGPPGLMKSPAMEQALKPLHRLEIGAREKNEKARQEYATQFQAFKLKKEAKTALAREAMKDNPAAKVDLDFGDEPKEPAEIRYVTNDSSYEALGELLIGNPTGILVERDEITSLLKFLDAEENATARGFYLTGWSGQADYAFDRIGRGHRAIPAVCIGIIGNTQPAKISEFIRRTNADGTGGDGLMQRFGLMVWPDPLTTWRNVDEYPDAEAKEAAWQIFERASKIDLNEAIRIGAKQDKYDSLPYLRFDQNGLKEFNEWRAKQEASIRSGELSPAIEGHFAKYRKLVPVLALINHVADEYEAGTVSQQSVLRALAFTKYLQSHVRRVYGAGILAEVAAAKAILRRIKNGDLVDGFSAREIQRKQWSHLTESHHITAGLDLLADHNFVAAQDRPSGLKGGRPSAAYQINPAVKPKNKDGAA